MEHAQKFIAGILKRAREAGIACEQAKPEIEAAEAELKKRGADALDAGRVRHLGACGVPERLLAAFRGPLDETKALSGAMSWLGQSKPFLLLTGGFGCGKSMAAAWTLLQARKTVKAMAHPLADEPTSWEEYDSRKGLYVTAAGLHFAPRFSSGSERTLFDRVATVPWLVLDELRAEDGKGAGRERLEEILGERYAMQSRTVITTNLQQSELRGVLGERLASRFYECCSVLDAGESDLRRVAK